MDDGAATRSRCRVTLGPGGRGAAMDDAAIAGGKVGAVAGAGPCAAAEVRAAAKCGTVVAENAWVAGNFALRATGADCCTTAGAGLTRHTEVAGRRGWLSTAVTAHCCTVGVDDATVGVATGPERCATAGSALATHPHITALARQVHATATAECDTFITQETCATAGAGCKRCVSGSTSLGPHAKIASRAARRLSTSHTA